MVGTGDGRSTFSGRRHADGMWTDRSDEHSADTGDPQFCAELTLRWTTVTVGVLALIITACW